tara:strand:- start:329 stop:1216 length:888 start_codon:yes stop_codon:yes gene_type:complete
MICFKINKKIINGKLWKARKKMSTKNVLNANQKKSEFIKLVGDEFSNQINSSNNRNSCLVIQSEAMKKAEYEFQKFSKEKDENGKEKVHTQKLSDYNAFKNSDITEITKHFVDWLFFENPQGKYNSKDNKNQWQIVRDSTICSIAIYKAQKEFGGNIIADNKLNKKGKVLINAEFISEYLPRLNKDEQKTPMYLSFAEVKQICLSWFQNHKASDGKATKLKGLSADIERLNKSLLAEIEDDFKKRHDEKIFDKMTMVYNTMNSYRSAYKNLYANNYAILTGQKVKTPEVAKKKSA